MNLTAKSRVVPIEPSRLPVIVSEITLSQYFTVAILSVLLYDSLITLGKEVKYFWKIPKRPVDFVYFANRYLRIVGATAFLCWNSFSATLPLCDFTQWTFGIANWITIISIGYILMIRVLVLYSQDKALVLFLKTLLLLEGASELGLSIYLTVLERVVLGEVVTTLTCGVGNTILWHLGMVVWLIPLAYGLVLMILALYKAAEYWRMSSGFKGFVLVKEDQLMYYALAIGCSMFAILKFKLIVSNAFLAHVLNNLGNPSFLCLLGSRMLFSMKEVGERGQSEGTCYRAPASTMSEMDFAEPVNLQSEMESGGSGADP